MIWNDLFLALFDRCAEHFRNGNREFETYYSSGDLTFLASIGYQPREFFDFVEDFCDGGNPSPSTALLVAAVRREWMLAHPEAPRPTVLLTRDTIPTFGDTIDGIAYLPRILAKARAKLCGALDPDLMYGCGGDRKFLREHGDIHPADFLRAVWNTGDDDAAVARWVGQPSAASGQS
jgi:hypothetical protein